MASGPNNPIEPDMNSDYIESVSVLVAEAIHDVNNWLQVITGLAQTEKIRSDNARTLDVLEQIDSAAQLAGRLTRALLRIARAAGSEKPGNVSEAVRCVLAMFAGRLEGRLGCQVSWRRSASLPPVVMPTDDLALVIANVVKNASDALRGVDEPELRVTTSVEDGRVTVDLWNSGEAIAEDVLPRVFDPFFSTKPRSVGTGLGLAICRRLLSASGGSIRVENSDTRGVHVIVDLPVVVATARGDRIEPVFVKPAKLNGRRVLLVDDDAVIRHVIGSIATDLGGADVVTCSSGEDALDLLRREKFDAVILDIRMPGVSGMDVYRSLSDDQKSRIIFLTGDTANRRVCDFITSTHRPALYKPVASDDVLNAVGRVVGNG